MDDIVQNSLGEDIGASDGDPDDAGESPNVIELPEEEFAPGPAKEIDEKELQPVVEILRTLAKTIKTFAVYPKDNPIYKKFTNELSEKFNTYFKHSDILTLDVQQHDLLYKGHVVYHSEDRNSNFSLILYVDGIRQLSFHEGLKLDELVEFIEILRVAPSEDNTDDDMVTLLWERDLEDITYFVPEELGEMEMGIEDELAGDVEAPGAEGGAEAEVGEGVGTHEGFDVPIPPDENLPPGLRPGTSPIHRMAETEGTASTMTVSAEYLDEVRRLEGEDLLNRTLALFFELIAATDSSEEIEGLARNISRIIGLLAKKKDIRGIVGVLRFLKKLSCALEDKAASTIISSTIQAAGSEENLMMLLGLKEDPALVAEYINNLEIGSAGAIMELLAKTDDKTLTKTICEALARMARTDSAPFVRALKDPRAKVVRNLVLVIGMSRNAEAVKQLDALVKHPDKSVRMMLVKALESSRAGEARLPLRKLLQDRDPGVRIGALRALRGTDAEGIYPFVMERILLEDFKGISFQEKRAFLEAFGAIGREDAMPFLVKMFGKFALFNRKENDELRACAAYGLGEAGGEQARALLEKGAASRNDVVKKACKEALARLREGDREA